MVRWIAAVLVLNLLAFVSLGSRETIRPGDELDFPILFIPILTAPLMGAMLACLHGLAPRRKWISAAGVFLLFFLPAAFAGPASPIVLLFLGLCLIPSLIAGGIGYLGGMGT